MQLSRIFKCFNNLFINFLWFIISRSLQSIQHILTDLTMEEMLQFKTWFTQWETELTLQQAMEGDLLDFVDKMMEVFGKKALLKTDLVFCHRGCKVKSKCRKAFR